MYRVTTEAKQLCRCENAVEITLCTIIITMYNEITLLCTIIMYTVFAAPIHLAICIRAQYYERCSDLEKRGVVSHGAWCSRLVDPAHAAGLRG